MVIREALTWAAQVLKNKSASPALDGEVLLSFVLKKTKEYLYANADYQLTKIQYSKFNILIRKRAHRWPVAYLIGHKEFYGLDFEVTPDVLVPRPESELLVERALSLLTSSLLTSSPPSGGEESKVRGWNIIDLGTGSGNIIISIIKSLQKRPSSPGEERSRRRGRTNVFKFYAIDPSNKALQIAKNNAHRHGLAKRIKFLRGDLLDPLSPIFSPLIRGRLRGGRILILANLPYLTPREYSSNPDLKHEPRSALIASPHGLKYFRQLFKQMQKKSPPARGREAAAGGEGVGEKRSNFILLLEHSPSQQPALAKLAKKYFPSAQIRFHKDLAGKYRMLDICLKKL